MKYFKIVLLCLLYLLLTSCASNQHLVFFTNTTIGVEVGSEPANGSPAKFIIGYKRQEGVIDPLIPDYTFIENTDKQSLNNLTQPENGDTNIILSPQGTAIPKGANSRAHSVIAKMNFGATGGGNNKASAAQFFATGRAADYLAKTENIAGALAGDPKVNMKSQVNIDALGKANYAYIHYFYRILNEFIKNNNANAGVALDIKNSVDELDKGTFKKTFKEYSYAGAVNSYNINDYSIPSTKGFRNILKHVKAQIDSLEVAKKMIIDNAATHNGSPLTATQKQEAVENISKYPEQIDAAKNVISANESIISMIKFVNNNILLGTSE